MERNRNQKFLVSLKLGRRKIFSCKIPSKYAFLNRRTILFLLAGVFFICLAGFYFFKIFSASAQEQLIIFPSVYHTNWQNPEAAFSKEAGETAAFDEFNADNSAYPFSFQQALKEQTNLILAGEAKERKLGFFEKIKNLISLNSVEAEEATTSEADSSQSSETETPAQEENIPSENTPSENAVPENPSDQGTSSEPAASSSQPVSEETSTTTDSNVSPAEEEPLEGENSAPQTPSDAATPAPQETLPPEGEEEPAAKTIYKRFYEFSNFSVAGDFYDKTIVNVQLRFSFAGRGIAGDKLLVEYYFQDSWQNLAVFDLENEISNSRNGGYFLYGLPVFENWGQLENFKIRFTCYRQKTEDGKPQDLFLDAVWLEVDWQFEEQVQEQQTSTEEQPQEPEEPQIPEESPEESKPAEEENEIAFVNPRESFNSNEEPEFILSKIEGEGFFEKIKFFFQRGVELKETSLTGPEGEKISAEVIFSEVKDDYKIKIRQLADFRPGEYLFKIRVSRAGKEYFARTKFNWTAAEVLLPEKIFSFFLEEEPAETRKELPWYPERFRPPEAMENNRGIDIETIADEKMPEKKGILLKGSCSQKYYVILIFANAEDYIQSPSSALFNKAFPCENGRYEYRLDGLPDYLASGTYYVLVGEEGESGPWYPITALQPVRVEASEP